VTKHGIIPHLFLDLTNASFPTDLSVFCVSKPELHAYAIALPSNIQTAKVPLTKHDSVNGECKYKFNTHSMPQHLMEVLCRKSTWYPLGRRLYESQNISGYNGSEQESLLAAS